MLTHCAILSVTCNFPLIAYILGRITLFLEKSFFDYKLFLYLCSRKCNVLISVAHCIPVFLRIHYYIIKK